MEGKVTLAPVLDTNWKDESSSAWTERGRIYWKGLNFLARRMKGYSSDYLWVYMDDFLAVMNQLDLMAISWPGHIEIIGQGNAWPMVVRGNDDEDDWSVWYVLKID